MSFPALDPFDITSAEDPHLRDSVHALVQLQLGLPYTNRPDQALRRRAYGARAIGIRAPLDVTGSYEWATGPAARIVLHQVLDHVRTTGCTGLSHRQLRVLFDPLDFSEQTCLRQLRRLAALMIEISSRTGMVIDRQPVGQYGDTDMRVSDWVASAAYALPALPTPATVREVAMFSRWDWSAWPTRPTRPTSPMPIDLLLWMTYIAPQVRGTATVPLTDLQQHIGTDTTAKKNSVYFFGLEIKDWLPAVSKQFPGLRITLTDTALVLEATRRCSIAVYGNDSAIDRRFSRLRQLSTTRTPA